MRRLIAAITVLSLPVLVAAGSPARASIDLVTCTGEQTVEFAPAVTAQEQENVEVTVTAHWGTEGPLLSFCLGSGITGGHGTLTNTVPRLSCTLAFTPPTGEIQDEVTYHFNNGNQRILFDTVTSTVSGGVGQVIATGEVIQGSLQGATATRIATYPAITTLLDECQNDGVEQVSGPATLVIAGR